MTAPVATEPQRPGDAFVPRILVFSTNNISDPGIDLAGSAHMHYSPGVKVIGLPVHQRDPAVLDRSTRSRPGSTACSSPPTATSAPTSRLREALVARSWPRPRSA